ncbi:MAG TPA: BON domain-containing protein [Alphaproteobacteria bacterium]|jgi:hyperosmotically inducible protein
MPSKPTSLLLAAVIAWGIGAGTAPAQVLDILTAPKTLVDRAIEARSADDIVKDNEIVLAVNGIMADLGTIKASTEIYEQRLLVTGLFDDKALYEKFLAETKKVPGVKKLYWHVRYMSEEEQKRREKEMLDWADALALDVKVGLELVGTRVIADVNFRVAVDSFSTVFLIGRARSREELDKALEVTRKTEGVKRVVNYVEVRP